MAAAFRLLAARARSEGELRERLEMRVQATPELVESCIARLKELELIDDARFAESYARTRLNAKPSGRNRLARELATKKVSSSTIDSALNAVFEAENESDLIDLAIQRRLRVNGPPRDRAAAKRLFDFLARRGFDFDLIRSKLSALTRTRGEE